jgi:hypothetical protein
MTVASLSRRLDRIAGTGVGRVHVVTVSHLEPDMDAATSAALAAKGISEGPRDLVVTLIRFAQ